MIYQPETIILFGAAIWVGAALVTGLPKQRAVPSQFPALFAIIGVIGSLIGVTELLPEDIDIALTLLAVLIYLVTPVVFSWHLYRVYPPTNAPTNRQLNQD